MLRTQRHFTQRLSLLVMGMILIAAFAACRPEQDTEITSKTAYSGAINGSPIEINVVAKINTGRGGNSTCTFTKIPLGFNPASLGTHG